MYCGGCVFVDHFSGMIHIELQQNLNSHETLAAKGRYEAMARDSGVIPQSYLSDNGPAFAAHDYARQLVSMNRYLSLQAQERTIKMV
jgi:hypothetical protein